MLWISWMRRFQPDSTLLIFAGSPERCAFFRLWAHPADSSHGMPWLRAYEVQESAQRSGETGSPSPLATGSFALALSQLSWNAATLPGSPEPWASSAAARQPVISFGGM